MFFLAGLIPLSQEIRPGAFAKSGKGVFFCLTPYKSDAKLFGRIQLLLLLGLCIEVGTARGPLPPYFFNMKKKQTSPVNKFSI